MIDEEYLNSSKNFFDETSIEIWKNVLSEETQMHYAFGESILNNRNIFENLSTALDVGCGWGGSLHKIKSISPNAHITGLTQSEQQASYIGDKFDVILANANEYITNSRYEIVSFIQSICHMKDTAFLNLAKSTDRIFINDFMTTDIDGSYLNERWVMKFRTIDDWEKMFNENGFEIKSFNILPLQVFKNNSAFWLNNIIKHNYSNITWQISVLEKLGRDFLDKKYTNTEHLYPYKSGTFLVDIYAERNRR